MPVCVFRIRDVDTQAYIYAHVHKGWDHLPFKCDSSTWNAGACMYVCIYTCLHKRKWAVLLLCASICDIYMCMCTHAHTCTCACICTLTYVCAHMRMYVYTCYSTSLCESFFFLLVNLKILFCSNQRELLF
jgi:hypothetical protein